jgi:myo-inositol 2-dehydrogenase / D-chiro-inositol 1-dehydrogenase
MTRRVAWVGCGRHAEQMLLPQLVRQDIDIVAFCDINPEAAAAMGRRYRVDRLFTDANEMLTLDGIDVVGVAAGPKAHRDVAIAALERGCAVFIEKPVGASVADALAIRAVARQAGRAVGTGFMKRFAAANRVARNVVMSPEFGPVAGFVGEYMTAPGYFARGEVVDYTSFFLHHCVHYMDLAPWFAGPVGAVTVFRSELSPGRLLLHVHLDFESGAVGTLIMGTIQSRGTPMERLQIMGDHRRVEVEDVFSVEYFRNPPFKADDPAAGLADGVDTLTWKPNLTAAVNEDLKGYHGLFTAFFDVLDGKPADLPGIDDGVAAMCLLEAVVAGAAQPGHQIDVARPTG